MKRACTLALLAVACSALAPNTRVAPNSRPAAVAPARSPLATLAAQGVALALALGGLATPALADGQTEKFNLPPIDKEDRTRCVLQSSAMGQANGARSKLYDLRECVLTNKQAVGFDLAAAILSDGADFSGTNFQEAIFSKAYARNAKFDGVDFSNGVVDRVSFDGSSLKGAIFTNAVMSGTSFEGANVENADFTDSFMGDFDQRKLCKNPTLKGENPKTGQPTRASAGCGP